MESAAEILALGPDFYSHFEFQAPSLHFYLTLIWSGTELYRLYLPKQPIAWLASVLESPLSAVKIFKLRSPQYYRTEQKQYRTHHHAVTLPPSSLPTNIPFTDRGQTLMMQFFTQPQSLSAEDLEYLQFHRIVQYHPLIRYFQTPYSSEWCRKTLFLSATKHEIFHAKAIFDHLPYYRISPSISPPRVENPTLFDLILPAELEDRISRQITDHFGDRLLYFGEYVSLDYSFLSYLKFHPRYPRPVLPIIYQQLLSWIDLHLKSSAP